MAATILKILSIYTPELVVWILLPLGASVLLFLLTQHLVSRSVASRFSPYPLMRKIIDRSLVRHSVWVSQTVFAFFIIMFVVGWGIIHGVERHRHAKALVNTLTRRAAEMAPEGQAFVLDRPIQFRKEISKAGDKTLTAYGVLGVEYYLVTAGNSDKEFEVILPRDLGLVHAERLLGGKFFTVSGESGIFSNDTLKAIRKSLRHPRRLEWFLFVFNFMAAIPTGLFVATAMMFTLTFPASIADRLWRKQLIRIIQRKVKANVHPALLTKPLPLTDLQIARGKMGLTFYLVKLPGINKKTPGRIVDLITDETPLPISLPWQFLRFAVRIVSLGRVRAFGFVFFPDDLTKAPTPVPKKLATR